MTIPDSVINQQAFGTAEGESLIGFLWEKKSPEYNIIKSSVKNLRRVNLPEQEFNLS